MQYRRRYVFVRHAATIDDHDDGALAERYRLTPRPTIINNIQSKSVTTVMFITLTIHLNARSHRGDVNEVN